MDLENPSTCLFITKQYTWRILFSMAKTIELFQYVQKIYQIVGICSSSNYHGQHRVSAKATFILGCMILSFNSSFAYFLFEANSVDEYGRSFYMSFSKLEIYLYFVVNLAKVEKILNLIKKLEDFVELSKLNYFEYFGILFEKVHSCECVVCSVKNRSPQFCVNDCV